MGIMFKPETDSARWFESLLNPTKQQLCYNIELWKDLIKERFQKDRGTMLREADALEHSFESKDKLPLQIYIN